VSNIYLSLKTKSVFVTVRLHGVQGGLLRVQRVKPNLDLLPADDNTIDCAGKRCAPAFFAQIFEPNINFVLASEKFFTQM
jgi:hypothetical protein